jgi:hypothetical protein
MTNATMNHTNSTFELEPQRMSIFFGHITTWSFVVYLLISITGVVANVLLLLAIFKDPLKCFRDATTYLIVNLSLSDILNLVLAIEELFLLQTKYGSIYDLPPRVAVINYAVFEFTAFLTYPSIFALALERSLAIIYPLWHKVHITSSTSYIWLTTVWLFGFVVAGVNSVLLYREQINIAKYTLMLPSAFFSLFTLVFYCIACMSIEKQRLATRSNNSLSEIHRRSIEVRLRTQKQFLFTVFVVNIGLISALVPTVVMTYYIDTNLETMSMDNADPIFVGLSYTIDILLHLNYGANPFIYVWRIQKYRKTFLSLYWRK